MIRIKDWTARRAGGRITITGKDADDGEPIKIVGVDRIEAGAKHALGGPAKPPVATDKSGDRYELL